MLRTRNIFIDTQVFVASNFFQNENLDRLAEFGNMDTVNIYLTEITINEIRSNIKEDLQTAQEEINRFKRSIESKGKILKNVEEYKKYINLPQLKLDIDYDKINSKLENFIEYGKVKIIPYQNVDLTSIMNRYFAHEKPFGSGKKKHEFPDAIVLSAVENWCVENSSEIYVISNDKDLKEYVSEVIIPIPNLRKILNKIHIQFGNDRVDWINKAFLNNQEFIKKSIAKFFEEKLIDEVGFDITIQSVLLSEILLHEGSIVEDRPDYHETIFELDFDVSFEAKVDYDDYSASMYDSEEDKWLFPERRSDISVFSTTQTAEVAIEGHFEEKEIMNISCLYTSIPDSSEITENLDGYMYSY